MSAPAQMPKKIGEARDGFTTDAEKWPPNVKSAHKKPSPTSEHLGLELQHSIIRCRAMATHHQG